MTTRETIVLAAIEVFAESGFSQGTFQQIADRCGLTQPAAFYYFKDKTALLHAGLELLVRENHAYVSQLVRPQDNALTRLLKHLEGNLAWTIERHKQAQLLQLVFYHASFDSEFSAKYRKLMKTGRLRIAELLHAGLREKLFRFEEPVDWMAEFIHRELMGSLIDALCSAPGLRSRDECKSLLREQRRRWKSLLSTLLGA